MGTPISIRLDDQVRGELEAEARVRGIGLATLLRDIAGEAARNVKRARVREDSERVGRYVASNPEAKESFDFWGGARADVGK